MTGLETDAASRTVWFSDRSAIAAHSVLLATCVSYRQLDASGLTELCGRGVFYGSVLTETSAS